MRFIESPVFTAGLRRHRDDEQIRALARVVREEFT
jgi:hypothetical protein